MEGGCFDPSKVKGVDARLMAFRSGGLHPTVDGQSLLLREFVRRQGRLSNSGSCVKPGDFGLVPWPLMSYQDEN